MASGYLSAHMATLDFSRCTFGTFVENVRLETLRTCREHALRFLNRTLVEKI